MKEQTQVDIRAHAVAEFPRESCGLVVIINGKERYWPCRNIAGNANDFAIEPLDLIAASDLGEVVAVVHSHPNTLAIPSEADKVRIEAHKVPWHIVHVSESGMGVVATEILTYFPCGYEAPLVGRTFTHGVLDCYSLVRDYYKRERGIELPDFDRRDTWWDKGDNLYMENFESAGFKPIKGAIQVGDGIIMQLRSPVPNHAGVYIGDGMILHHVQGRLSSRDVYDGYWQEITRVIVRHGQ